MDQPFARVMCHPLSALLISVAAAPAPTLAQTAPERIEVQAFEVTGNTLLTPAQIDKTLAPYKGRRSVEELKRAAAALQARYREAGHGAVIAFVPEQTARGGTITINVIEGRITAINISGNRLFDDANIRASLPSLVVGRTPLVREIDSQIQLANENPAKEIEVLMQPGAQPGQVDANIAVTEEPVSRFSVGLDNTGNKTTGRWRASLGYQHAALFDRDHVLTMQLQVAPEKIESVTVVSANYRIPLYARTMALDVYAAYSDVDGGTTATVAGPLQFSGRGRIYGLRAGKYLPRQGEIDQRLIVGLDNRDYINSCSIANLPGSCGNAGENVSVQPLAVEYVLQKGGESRWGASVGLQHNLQLGGRNSDDAQFRKLRPGSDPRYTTLRFGLFGAFPVAESWQLQGRLIGQTTADALVPGEQFGIGGASSVRGYEEREITGDRGVAAAVELISPNLAARVGMPTRTLRAIGFADAGWVQNRLNTPCRLNESECHLGSVGIGVRFGSGHLQAKLDVAYALSAAVRTGRHDTRAHAALSYTF